MQPGSVDIMVSISNSNDDISIQAAFPRNSFIADDFACLCFFSCLGELAKEENMTSCLCSFLAGHRWDGARRQKRPVQNLSVYCIIITVYWLDNWFVDGYQ